MPRVTIWIRNEDMTKWEAIEDRPEWLHEQLNKPKKLISDLPIETKPEVPDNMAYMFKEKDIKIGKVVKLLAVNPVPITSIPHLEDVRENINNNQLKAAAKSYCKHGQQKGNCLAKDNKGCNK